MDTQLVEVASVTDFSCFPPGGEKGGASNRPFDQVDVTGVTI